MTITIYGIKNCNTMKKAFTWLDDNNVEYGFHDYKKHAPDTDVLTHAFAAHGWESVINRKGMTWRKLPDDVKANMDENGAMEIALEKPSIIKRPLMVRGDDITLGFSEDTYSEIFN